MAAACGGGTVTHHLCGLRRQVWCLGGLLVLAGVVVAIAAPGAPLSTEPPPGFDPYLRRSNGTAADPVNLIFRGTDAEHVAAAVQRVLGWRPVTGSMMHFLDQGRVRPAAWQLGVDLGGGSRLHLRIETVTRGDAQSYVLVAAHRDDRAPCGHVGRGFDETRDLIARSFASAGYAVASVWLGNTAPSRHCDGSLTEGDGNASLIELRASR